MKPSFTTYWRGLACGARTSVSDLLLVKLLIPLAIPYALIQVLRSALYRSGIVRTKRLPRPVISIGNITVGGTGKTPVTAHIARFLLHQGYKVAVLSRGYGGSLEGETSVVSDGKSVMLSAQECGDEPFLLASTIPGLMVVIGTDRYAAGMVAMEQLAPDIFLLDDGFQHLRLHRDLNILLLDYSCPFGNGWTLPAGLLREPRSAARRADLIIHTRSPHGAPPNPLLSDTPSCTARHELADCLPLSGGEPFPLAHLRGKRVCAFAGIADPQAFFDELRRHGLNLVATLSLPDHVAYDNQNINAITGAFNESCADCAITTEKDGVKLVQLPWELEDKILLAPLSLTIADPTRLYPLLFNLLQK